MGFLWFKGLLASRSGRLLGAVAGVAVTVALLASIGAFIVSSSASMTRQAVKTVKVDWQVQLVPGTAPASAMQALAKASPYQAAAPVGYAHVPGFSASSHGTTQTTSAGQVVGLPPDYQSKFPGQIRGLIGATRGVLLAQQTAANLHASVGDKVVIQRQGLAPISVVVDGIVSLPNADSFFQAVGVPKGIKPHAPPDNVVLLPLERWHQLFDPQAKVRPDSVHTQVHAKLDRSTLPPRPGAAYIEVQNRARNLEARLAGNALVADNLAARLDGVRADALYAKVLFLFLGLPGAALAILLTLAVTASGAQRRRHEQALLRIRGASQRQVLGLAGVEAVTVGGLGVIVGIVLMLLATRLLVGTTVFGPSGFPALWVAGAAVTGLALALAAVLYPAWRDLHGTSVVASRAEIGRSGSPLWQRLYLDVVFLALAGAVFWRTASSGYQLVLAPEGVAKTSVNYDAFIAPVFLWLGMGLLVMRLMDWWLRRRRSHVARTLRPLAGGLASVVASSLSQRRSLVVRGVVLVALAFSFATSTAVFNTTYNAQTKVDAQLTNGSDVTVTGTMAHPLGGELPALAALPGVKAAQPMLHRYAYVGNDLQDMYAIQPHHLTAATQLSDAFFPGSTAKHVLAALAAKPDAVLVSAETVRDYQLSVGDRLNLRMQSAKDHKYHVVPFTFVGIVQKFPTAPRDSFLVANASYVAKATGMASPNVVLMRTSAPPGTVAKAARKAVASVPGASVSDIGSTQYIISSSLTAVDLHGLTRLELAFAILLLAGAAGLVLALRIAERRRAFAILTGIGANRRQLGAFLWSEGVLVSVAGAALGLVTGFGVAEMLTKVLTGVFDPPPQSLSVPWSYLAVLALATAAAAIAAVLGMQRVTRRPPVEALRDL